MTAVGWARKASDGRARAGVLTTPHGDVPTPAFMPVGTRGVVKTLAAADVEALGADIVLANTYHLMLRPGEDVVAGLGGLHGFTGWRGPYLTDSGGYQVFSLSPEVDDDGVTFKSVYDGAKVRLTPERAVAVQEALGADIAMVLDELVGLPAETHVLERAMERTLRWADRSLAARTRDDQALFGIVQGGADTGLRARSAAETAKRSFDGFGIGGLSVGESAEARSAAIDASVAELPASRIRYVMGLGDIEGMLDAISRGVDLFDCVLPTRLARHGKALHRRGDLSIRRSEFATSADPIDEECGCATCATHSRGYLRHLFATRESTGPRLLTIHNLWYTLDVMRLSRIAIVDGRFDAYRAQVVSSRGR